MARSKFTSPTLTVHIDPARREWAIQSDSGACLIADAITTQYPQYSDVLVDMATIRITDRKRGYRYVYLTPPEGQHVLLAYDQGWTNPFDQVVIKRAVKVIPITRAKTGKYSAAATAERRARRITELETKIQVGEELTPQEKATLSRMRNAPPPIERPSSRGPAEVKIVPSNKHGSAIVHGSSAPVLGEAHPNLLRGRDRHFGARIASPGFAFQEAVEIALVERLAEEKAKTKTKAERQQRRTEKSTNG